MFWHFSREMTGFLSRFRGPEGKRLPCAGAGGGKIPKGRNTTAQIRGESSAAAPATANPGGLGPLENGRENDYIHGKCGSRKKCTENASKPVISRKKSAKSSPQNPGFLPQVTRGAAPQTRPERLQNASRRMLEKSPKNPSFRAGNGKKRAESAGETPLIYI